MSDEPRKPQGPPNQRIRNGSGALVFVLVLAGAVSVLVLAELLGEVLP